MPKQYDKLVRDKIPEIIEADGGTPVTRVLNDDEYHAALIAKLFEEAGEYRDNPSDEEWADIQEVVLALGQLSARTPHELEVLRLAKRDARGGFDERIFLEKA